MSLGVNQGQNLESSSFGWEKETTGCVCCARGVTVVDEVARIIGYVVSKRDHSSGLVAE